MKNIFIIINLYRSGVAKFNVKGLLEYNSKAVSADYINKLMKVEENEEGNVCIHNLTSYITIILFYILYSHSFKYANCHVRRRRIIM